MNGLSTTDPILPERRLVRPVGEFRSQCETKRPEEPHLELHDWLYPGEGLSRPFIWAMHHFDRDFIVRGEHVISIRNPL